MSICLDLFCCRSQVSPQLLTHSNFCCSLSVLGWHQGRWIGNASKVCWFGNPGICKVGSIKPYQTTKVCMNPPSSSIWFAAMRQSALVIKAPGSVEASRERNVFGEFVLFFWNMGGEPGDNLTWHNRKYVQYIYVYIYISAFIFTQPIFFQT